MNSFESFDYSSWRQSNSAACGRDILLDFRFYFVNRIIMGTHFSVKSLSICPYCVELRGIIKCMHIRARMKRVKGDNNLTQQRCAM